jgi:hypothetical protein
LKAAILRKVFGITSIDALDRAPLQTVDTGLSVIRLFCDRYLIYAENCVESNTPMEPKQIGEILDETIAQNTTKDDLLV